MARIILLLICNSLILQTAMGQEKNFVELLKQNTHVISDFNRPIYGFLDSIVANKRIVFLGEATHQDGSSLKLKSNVIRYLISKHHYQVVLFETNLFEMDAFCRLSRQALDNNILSKTAFGVNGEYSKETVDIVDYLLSLKSIEIGGFDIGYNSWLGNLLKSAIIEAFKEKRIFTKSTSKSIESYINHLNSFIINYQFDVAHKADFQIGEFQSLSDDIIKCLRNYQDDSNVELLLQVINSNLILVNWIKDREPITNPNEISQYSNFLKIREVGMAENLSWLVARKFKDKKIIISTSTYHMSGAINGLRPMRSYLSTEIINSAMFYPIIWYGHDKDLSEAERSGTRPEQSLEYFLNLSGIPIGFVDFHDVKLMHYVDTINVTFSDALPKKATWSKIYDGAFYIRNMNMTVKRLLTPAELDYFQHQLLKKVKQ